MDSIVAVPTHQEQNPECRRLGLLEKFGHWPEVATKEFWKEWDRRTLGAGAQLVQYYAHMTVWKALKSGLLKRPENCSRCGKPESLNSRALSAHHEDHRAPLMVSWLCEACHKQRHRELGTYSRNGKPTSRRIRTAPNVPMERLMEVRDA